MTITPAVIYKFGQTRYTTTKASVTDSRGSASNDLCMICLETDEMTT